MNLRADAYQLRDILTGVGYESIAKMQRGVSKALVNTGLVMPADFTRKPDLQFPLGSMERETTVVAMT